jgi:DNA-directed RNA polymerase sigma subunit (sigma70/sigma32)
MDKIKDAFSKIKMDITFLSNELKDIKEMLTEITSKEEKTTELNKTNNFGFQDLHEINSDNQTDTNHHNHPLEALKTPFQYFSKGNEGVSTDRQTDRQTDNPSKPRRLEGLSTEEVVSELQIVREDLKKVILSLTTQELTVFCTVYSLEDKGFSKITYSLIAKELGLTESSIRDYITRLFKKKAPLEKKKINNKQVSLRVSPGIKVITSLSSIISLKGI